MLTQGKREHCLITIIYVILGLKPVSLSANEFFIHCDTWNYVEKIQKALEQKSEILLAGNVLEIAETAIYTEPMEQYQMAGTRGYVLVVPDQVANQLSGEKIRLVMKLENVITRLIS